MCMIEFQREIEILFHKNQLFRRIKSEFTGCADFDFSAHMLAHEIPEEFGYDLLVQMVLHKRAMLPVLVGQLRKHFYGDSQATADALLEAARADLVDLEPTTLQFIVRIDITPDVQAELDRYQYPLPMVVPPLLVRTNEETGYYTHKNSVILKDNHHDDDVCLDHLNRVNGIALRLNMNVADNIQNQWKNLDKPKEGEDQKEFDKRKRAFEKYDRTSRDVLEHLGIASGGEFYLTHRYDKRGRSYCQGYHVNYQSTDWCKAVVEFRDGEVVV